MTVLVATGNDADRRTSAVVGGAGVTAGVAAGALVANDVGVALVATTVADVVDWAIVDGAVVAGSVPAVAVGRAVEVPPIVVAVGAVVVTPSVVEVAGSVVIVVMGTVVGGSSSGLLGHWRRAGGSERGHAHAAERQGRRTASPHPGRGAWSDFEKLSTGLLGKGHAGTSIGITPESTGMHGSPRSHLRLTDFRRRGKPVDLESGVCETNEKVQRREQVPGRET